ncbi:MAG: hypothetical protein HY597_05720 [Candidatus Omnitrophica bacterium]|nr:hypothetical protein [Candidatus Omnitrophota bacterium]
MTQFSGTLLASGVVAAATTATLQFRSVRWERRKEFLEHQLRLYGPAYALIAQNRDAFERIKSIHVQGEKRLSGVIGAEKDIDATIAVANEHIRRIVLSNNEILEDMLKKNLHFIDPDDIQLVTQFFHDMANLKVETSADVGTKLPLLMALDLPNISFMRPGLIECFEQRFRQKQVQFREMLGSSKRHQRDLPTNKRPLCAVGLPPRIWRTFAIPVLTGLMVALFWHFFEVVKPWKITLFLPYAYEYAYRGATNTTGNQSREILPVVPIRVRLTDKASGFVFAVHNDNIRSLHGVSLHLQLPPGVEVTDPGPFRAFWPNEEYFFSFGDAVLNHGVFYATEVRNTAGELKGSIQLKFSQPREYEIIATVSGEDMLPAEKKIKIVVVP